MEIVNVCQRSQEDFEPNRPRKRTLMKAINPLKAGAVVGALVAAWHVGWAALVAIGWAQPFIDFIFRIHFIRPVYVIQSFEIGTAIILIAVTAISGFLIGYIFSVIWNRLHLG